MNREEDELRHELNKWSSTWRLKKCRLKSPTSKTNIWSPWSDAKPKGVKSVHQDLAASQLQSSQRLGYATLAKASPLRLHVTLRKKVRHDYVRTRAPLRVDDELIDEDVDATLQHVPTTVRKHKITNRRLLLACAD